LAEAFFDYPLFSSVIREENRLKALSLMFEVDLKYALKRGAAYALDAEMNEVSAWYMRPNWGRDFTGYLTCIAPRTLGLFRLVGREGLKTLEKTFEEVDAYMARQKLPGKTAYLSSIGVRKAAQGQHRASKLLVPVLEALEDRGYGAYLYTNSPKNIAVYEKFGFRLMDTLVNKAVGCESFFMLKEAKKV